MTPCDKDGNAVTEGDVAEGQPLSIKVTITRATGLRPAPLAKIMFTDPSSKQVIETEALPAESGAATWDFSHVISFDAVTKEQLEWIKEVCFLWQCQ